MGPDSRMAGHSHISVEDCVRCFFHVGVWGFRCVVLAEVFYSEVCVGNFLPVLSELWV